MDDKKPTIFADLKAAGVTTDKSRIFADLKAAGIAVLRNKDLFGVIVVGLGKDNEDIYAYAHGDDSRSDLISQTLTEKIYDFVRCSSERRDS